MDTACKPFYMFLHQFLFSLALGSLYPQPNQTVLSAHLQPINGNALGNVVLHSAFDIENYKFVISIVHNNDPLFRSSTPNQEFTLMLERQRLSQVTGVTDYYADIKNGSVLLITGTRLYRSVGFFFVQNIT